jgi:hypothetical protein
VSFRSDRHVSTAAHLEDTYMFRLVLVLASLCGPIVVSAGIIPQLPTVPLSQIPTELTPLDPGGVLDRVSVYLCDTDPYGTFFFEVARVQGTLVLADSLTTRFGRSLAVAASGVYEVPQSDPGQWPDVVDQVTRDETALPAALASLREDARRLEEIIGPLLSAGERAPGLLAQIPGLTQNAPASFSGLRGKLKAARVLNAMRGSTMQLQEAGASSVRTAGNIRAIVAAMKH